MNSSHQFHIGALATALLVVLASVVNVSTQEASQRTSSQQPSPLLAFATKLLASENSAD